VSTEPIARFFDRENRDCCRPDADLGGGVSGVSGTLLDRLEDAGIQGRSLLDLGCGTGTLAVDAVRRGASRATGVDLSPNSIEVARRRARTAALEERTSFQVGDAASITVEPHDVVTLDKVVCCYPDPNRLLDSASSSAQHVLAFNAPESRGGWGVASRVAVFFENLWRRIRRDPFRAFVHQVPRLEEIVRSHGFERRSSHRHWVWLVNVYVREG
jgi:SAM-dependent methyltransferase